MGRRRTASPKTRLNSLKGLWCHSLTRNGKFRTQVVIVQHPRLVKLTLYPLRAQVPREEKQRSHPIKVGNLHDQEQPTSAQQRSARKCLKKDPMRVTHSFQESHHPGQTVNSSCGSHLSDIRLSKATLSTCLHLSLAQRHLYKAAQNLTTGFKYKKHLLHLNSLPRNWPAPHVYLNQQLHLRSSPQNLALRWYQWLQ
jgi:hypothetical protein